jgi:large subunit ribosomal protein L31
MAFCHKEKYALPAPAGCCDGAAAAAAQETEMKQGIHPDYVECKVKCGCGNEFTTHATQPEIHVEICGACHPFYTGKQKLVDTAGRVEKFQRRFGNYMDRMRKPADAQKAES